VEQARKDAEQKEGHARAWVQVPEGRPHEARTGVSGLVGLRHAPLSLTSIEAPRGSLGLALDIARSGTRWAEPVDSQQSLPRSSARAVKPRPKHPDALWDANEVAAFLGASASYVYKKVEAGKIPFVRIGWMVRFSPDAIRAWVKGNER
jgi:excisionase family DNA binding protein